VDYWDTSAILKLYVPERDSAFFLDLVAKAGQPVFSSAIAATEVLSALFRKERAADLKPGGARALFRRFQADCSVGRIVLLPYGGDVIAEAEKLVRIAFEQHPPVMVRSLDLIHVASAVVGKATSLVATDERLRAFASLVRLTLVP
jgi:predicted nucleic acid-binding protein